MATTYRSKDIELDKLYNMDCLEGMRSLPDSCVDLIVCDPPYGTIKGIGASTDKFKKDTTWDVVIPTDQLFDQYERVLRRGGHVVLFSQEPYTCHLRTFTPRNMEFCYPMIWYKDQCGNPLLANTAPVSLFEDISVWTKKHDSANVHPLRQYARLLVQYIGKDYKAVIEDFKAKGYDKPTRAQHFLAYDCVQFGLCTEEMYDLLIKDYAIDKWSGYYEYCDLMIEDEKYRQRYARVFNLPPGKASVSNVLEYRKDLDTFHPTQKPVALIAHIIRQYTNPGDIVLDSCMGSGTTAVACIREKRHWIGYELNTDFYNQATARIKQTLATPTLF